MNLTHWRRDGGARSPHARMDRACELDVLDVLVYAGDGLRLSGESDRGSKEPESMALGVCVLMPDRSWLDSAGSRSLSQRSIWRSA